MLSWIRRKSKRLEFSEEREFESFSRLFKYLHVLSEELYYQRTYWNEEKGTYETPQKNLSVGQRGEVLVHGCFKSFKVTIERVA